MEHLHVDVAVVGSGFGGSLTALLLHRIGRSALLVDSGAHPRFAIGESSTPTADCVLARLARQYDLPRLAPLAKYGTWKASYPQLGCGVKRGFSYFKHHPGQPFQPAPRHANELLVAASSRDLEGDTHWLRQDVDAFLVEEAQAAGVKLLDRTQTRILQHEPSWQLDCRRGNERYLVTAGFVVDATGPAGFLPQALALPSEVRRLKTDSRTIFAHFSGVRPWRECLRDAGGRIDEHPFDCDRAALHHLLDEGWMFQLRFDDGVASCGFVLDQRRPGVRSDLSAQQEWDQLLDRYPAIAGQFASARIVRPNGGLCRTGRLQRLVKPIAGVHWALLPHAAGFIDPLHSTGIAQTLCGVERLVWILDRAWKGAERRAALLRRYGQIVRRELLLVDEIVAGGYAALQEFRLFAAYSMLYFAAATTYERRRHEGQVAPLSACLCADDERFCRIVADVSDRLHLTLAGMRGRSSAHAGGEAAIADFERHVAAAIEPYNHTGLCDPSAHNMYRFTAIDG